MGNFYVKSSYKPGVDSIAIEGTLMEDPIINLRPSVYYGFGYSFHFLGNYSNQILANDRGSDEYKLHWDFFVSAGFTNRIYLLENATNIGRFRNFALELNGGVRLGIKGIYIFGGYEYSIPISTRLVINETEYDGYELESIDNSSIFFGLGFRNSIYLKGAIRQITTVKTMEQSIDNFEFTIGFGI